MSYPGAPQQQYPAAPPPYPQYWAPPPVRRRRSRWLTVGLPLAGVLLVGGCTTAVGLLLAGMADDLRPAQQAAGAYAQALVDERWDDAHDLLCTQDRDAVTPGDLAAHYAEPDLTGYRVDGIHVNTYNGEKSGRADITFTTADGLTDRQSLPLVQDGEAWRPCP
ncbi:hypothetical protein ACI78T_05335 [Blastococcus sp. SYSU D00922]